MDQDAAPLCEVCRAADTIPQWFRGCTWFLCTSCAAKLPELPDPRRRDTTPPIALRVPRLAEDEPAQALVSLTSAWIEQLLQGMPTPSLIVHLLRALALIDRPLAEQYARAYELVI